MSYVVGGGSESSSDAFQSTNPELDSPIVYFDPPGLDTAHSGGELALGYDGDALVGYSANWQDFAYEENVSSWSWWSDEYPWLDGTQAVPSQHFALLEFAEGDLGQFSTQENETEQGKKNNVESRMDKYGEGLPARDSGEVIQIICRYLEHSELLSTIAKASQSLRRFAFESWKQAAFEAFKEQKDRISQDTSAVNLNSFNRAAEIAQVYIVLTRICRGGGNAAEVLKPLCPFVRDFFIRSVCAEINGLNNKEKYDAKIKSSFGARCTKTLFSQMHNSYRQHVRRAALPNTFASKSQQDAHRRKRKRGPRLRIGQISLHTAQHHFSYYSLPIETLFFFNSSQQFCLDQLSSSTGLAMIPGQIEDSRSNRLDEERCYRMF